MINIHFKLLSRLVPDSVFNQLSSFANSGIDNQASYLEAGHILSGKIRLAQSLNQMKHNLLFVVPSIHKHVLTPDGKNDLSKKFSLQELVSVHQEITSLLLLPVDTQMKTLKPLYPDQIIAQI